MDEYQYVCMHVCMYVRMYIGMFICITYVCLHKVVCVYFMQSDIVS